VLEDCRRIYDKLQDKKQVKSTELALELNHLEDREWGDYRNAMGVSPRWVAAVLKRYKIFAEERALRFADGSEARGYLWENFKLAWKRYLPPSQMSLAS
jgi:hypothetical protein